MLIYRENNNAARLPVVIAWRPAAVKRVLGPR